MTLLKLLTFVKLVFPAIVQMSKLRASVNSSLALRPMIQVTWIFAEYQTGAIPDHSFEAIT